MQCFHCESENVKPGGGCASCWSCEDCGAHGCSNFGNTTYRIQVDGQEYSGIKGGLWPIVKHGLYSVWDVYGTK